MSRSRRSWLQDLVRRRFPSRPAKVWRRPGALRLEQLEDRVTPNAYLVDFAGDASASSGGHMTAPISGDLRYCLSQAIADQQADTISFASSLAGQTITLSSSLVTAPSGFANPYGQTAFVVGASDNVTIDGSGAPGLTLSGNGATRLFAVEGGGTLTWTT